MTTKPSCTDPADVTTKPSCVDPAVLTTEASCSDLAVVVVNFNRWPFLARCLQSIQVDLATSGLRAETWVVDNASEDGSAQMVRDHFPDVHVIANERNRGFAAANNQAIAAAQSRYVLLLNNDCEVLPGSLAHLVAYADAHPDAGGVGCMLLRGDGEPHRLPASIFSALAWFPEKPCKVAWIVGAALLLRREAIAAVGGLDEDFFFYYEDWDLGLRLRKAGWTNHYTPGARVIHYERASTSLVRRPQTLEYLRRGHLLMLRKHFPLAYPFALAWQWLAARFGPGPEAAA